MARSTEACAPTTSAKPDQRGAAAIAAVARRETPTTMRSAKIEAETSATLKPDTAST